MGVWWLWVGPLPPECAYWESPLEALGVYEGTARHMSPSPPQLGFTVATRLCCRARVWWCQGLTARRHYNATYRRTSGGQVVGICSTGLESGTRKAELVWRIRTGLEVGTREAMFGVAGKKSFGQ